MVIRFSLLFTSISLVLSCCEPAELEELSNEVPDQPEFKRIQISPEYKLVEVASSAYQWTGVAVSEGGRIFVNFPRWGEIPLSVAELNGGNLRPYPDISWNSWENGMSAENRFVCVQSVYIDKKNNLWVLDAGSLLGSGVVTGAPKLLKIDISTNSIVRVYPLDEQVVFGMSYPNDVRVDTDLNFAYLTESGVGSIICVDLNSGIARRVIDHHPSVKAEPLVLNINGKATPMVVHADGIALNKKRDYLYYKALTGKKLYRIKTENLRDSTMNQDEIHRSIEFVKETIPCDGMVFDPRDNLYLTSIEDNSIYMLDRNKRLKRIFTDPRLEWPDSFSIRKNGDIYLTTSRISYFPGTHYVFHLAYAQMGK
jgi:sugar lactone lactonase YvrE